MKSVCAEYLCAVLPVQERKCTPLWPAVSKSCSRSSSERGQALFPYLSTSSASTMTWVVKRFFPVGCVILPHSYLLPWRFFLPTVHLMGVGSPVSDVSTRNFIMVSMVIEEEQVPSCQVTIIRQNKGIPPSLTSGRRKGCSSLVCSLKNTLALSS